MRILFLTLLFSTGLIVNAQKIEMNGITYEIEDKVVLKNGIAQVNPLSYKEIKDIKKAIKTKIGKEKKELKQLDKRYSLLNKYIKTKNNYLQAEKKFNKKKMKGELSPKEITKRLSKLEKLKKEFNKAREKLLNFN